MVDNKEMSLMRLDAVNQDNKVSFPSIDMLQKNQIAETLKELFNERKIAMITDLNDSEIKLITRIAMIAEQKNLNTWREGIAIYQKLLLSKKRESRKEIIKAIGGLTQKKGLGERIKDVFKPSED